MGGLPVLFPVLEQLSLATPDQQAADPSTGSDFITPDVTTPADGDWVILPSSRASGQPGPRRTRPPDSQTETGRLEQTTVCVTEARLEKNLVATFLLVLKHFLTRHLINQENLLHSHGVATLGALLQKVCLRLLEVTISSPQRVCPRLCVFLSFFAILPRAHWFPPRKRRSVCLRVCLVSVSRSNASTETRRKVDRAL